MDCITLLGRIIKKSMPTSRPKVSFAKYFIIMNWKISMPYGTDMQTRMPVMITNALFSDGASLPSVFHQDLVSKGP